MPPQRLLDSYRDPQAPDTICGIATPLGQGGIGVIRLSGPETFALADQMFHGKHSPSETESHRILHGHFKNPETGEKVDEILLSIFRQPNSYTGDDVVEFSFHGSPAVLSTALQTLIDYGARLAAPGEFTFRAFYNGRIDLTQAEGVAALVGAQSEKAAQAAYRQVNGSLRDTIAQLRSDLTEAMAWLEMSTDFIEEDIEFKKVEEITERLTSIENQLTDLQAYYQRSRVMREGFRVTIIGAPNVGKSSIFNRLVARERSIVTEIAGTTRDAIDDAALIDGYPVRFIDTAGIRQTEDLVETIGIDHTVRHLEDSDLLLWIIDATVGFTNEDQRVSEKLMDRPCVVAINKIDIADTEYRENLVERFQDMKVVRCSAATGQGLNRLTRVLGEAFRESVGGSETYPFLINQRHRDALRAAGEHLALAKKAIEAGESHEFAAFDLRKAANFLGEITGETTPDDVLHKIFADFCIGK